MSLTRYANPESGVSAYHSLPSAISVEFADGMVYVYDHSVTGRTKVERMKRLAREGRGLATFISQQVGEQYAAKFTRAEYLAALAEAARRAAAED